MVAPENNIANTHTSKKLMSPNFENTIARPDDTALSIQRGHPPSRASTESSCSSSPSLMNNSPPSDCDYAERVAAQNNIDIETDNAPPPAGPQKYDFAMPPSQMPRAPMRMRLTNPPLLTTSIRPQNPPCPWSSPIALMSRLTLTCGTAILQLPLCSARMNSCRAMFATWHASSNSEVWKDATATTSPNWNYLVNQPGSSYP